MPRMALVRTCTLDLSSLTGYAVGGAGGIDFSGSRQLPKTGSDCGTYLCAYRGWLTGLIQKNGIKRIIFEAPVLDKKNGLIAVKKMTGLANVTEMVCRDLGVECFECHLSQIRSHFIGTSRAPPEVGKGETADRAKAIRRAWIKQRVMYECRQRGHTPGDDNEGDAIALFYFQKALLDPMRTDQLKLMIIDENSDDDGTPEAEAA